MLISFAIVGIFFGSCFASASVQQLQPHAKGLKDSKSIKPRIIGGNFALRREFPYQGLLRIRFNSTLNIICGCVLIQSRWALSAARCTYRKSASDLEVTFGTTNRISTSIFIEKRRVTELYNHPSYNSTSNEFDISLLRFFRIIFDSSTSSIALPTLPAELLAINHSSCTVTGWGGTSESSSFPSTSLKKATVPLVNNSECLRLFSSIGLNVSIVDSMICAGFEQGGVGPCNGDNGGPLACQFFNGTPVLIGIFSFGIGCARAQRPGVYTRVYSYNDWIQTTISENTDDNTNDIDSNEIQTTTAETTNDGISAKKPAQYFKHILLIALLAITKYHTLYD